MNILICSNNTENLYCLVEQALASREDHQVTVFVNADANPVLPPDDRLSVFKGDMEDVIDLNNVFERKHFAVFDLTLPPGERRPVYGNFMRHAVFFADKYRLRKIVLLCGRLTGPSRFQPAWMYNLLNFWTSMADRFARKDMQLQVEAVRNTPGRVKWTIIQPGLLSGGPLTKKYYEGSKRLPMLWSSVSRPDLAHSIIRMLEFERFSNEEICIFYT